MKYRWLLSLFVFMAMPFLHGDPLVEVKVGYFFFANKKMRDIYDHGGIDIQISGSYPVYKELLSLYGSLEYLYRSGHSLNGDQKTHIWQAPISAGLRVEPRISSFAKWYFTLGPRYFIVRSYNDSFYVPQRMSKNNFGFFSNTGILFTIGPQWICDVFGEYSWGKFFFNSNQSRAYGEKTQVGGFTFGAGFGCTF